MNCFFLIIIILNIFGVLECRHSDIDINRTEYLSNKVRRDIYKNNDYDGDSSRSSNIFAGILSPTAQKVPKHQSYQVHAPKEDPRLFYQSDIYLEEMRNSPNLNEASQIYPGRHVIRSDEPIYKNSFMPLRYMSANLHREKHSKTCIKCPADRTLVGNIGLDLVLLQKPKLVTCAGKRAPKYTKLVHINGPKFGSLLEEGSYLFSGKILYKQKIVQYCRMKIHVITNVCFVPKFLSKKCDPRTKVCNFTCPERGYALIGSSRLYCNSTNQWNGTLPYCKAPAQYCNIPPAPEFGRLNCRSNMDGKLPEGTKCKIYCNKGWRKNARMSLCLRGTWTHNLTCLRKHQKNEKRNQDPTSKHFISLKEFNK